MREIDAQLITEAVKNLCIESNYTLPNDIEEAIKDGFDKEESPAGKAALKCLLDNIDAAKEMNIPICQDTGMAVVFMEIGQDVHIKGNIENAINEGVRQGYLEGYLRCSVVNDPFNRINTKDNTPAIIHTRIADGDKIKITVAPKGFGSENMSALKMFNPSATKEDVLDFICETVEKAGSNPCPPIIVGVGIGGNFEYSAFLAKKALLRDIGKRNEDKFYAGIETEALNMINKTGIGPQGFGGRITALAVNIENYPTHIAGLPVAVNIGCHVTRHKSTIL